LTKKKDSQNTQTLITEPLEPASPTAITQQKEFEYKYFKLDTSKLVSLIKKDLQATNEGSAFLSQYNKEDVMRYLQSPVASEKIIRQISNLLYNLSPQYKRLLHYLSSMARFDHIVNINNITLLEQPKEQVKNKYLKSIKYLENMNIKHEFSKITDTLFIQDIFFGYDYSTDHSYYIQPLPTDYCRVNGWADGVRTFEFDFSYYNSTKNREELDTNYAPEFKEKYELYKEKGKDYRWQELTLENSVCLKLNESLSYSIPFFASVFPDVFDLQDYKLLTKARTELENYVILIGKIPYIKNSDTVNSFQLLLDDAISFGNKLSGVLPPSAGFALSPYETVEAIHLGDKNQVANNTLADAEKSFWDACGVNQSIFNSDKVTEESIRKSIVADETIIFKLYKQFERWLNRKIKLCLNNDFAVKIIDSTYYNHLELAKAFKEQSIYGLPLKREICAVLGQSPLEMECSIKMEEVLSLDKRLFPLTSSNTLSPDKVNGRPAQDSTGADNTGKKIVKDE